MFRRQISLHYEMMPLQRSCYSNPYNVLLNVSRIKFDVRRHFFTKRIALIWNILPPSIVDLRSAILQENYQ